MAPVARENRAGGGSVIDWIDRQRGPTPMIKGRDKSAISSKLRGLAAYAKFKMSALADRSSPNTAQDRKAAPIGDIGEWMRNGFLSAAGLAAIGIEVSFDESFAAQNRALREIPHAAA